MNQGDDFYRRYAQVQHQAGQLDRASTFSLVAFTAVIGYILYFVLQIAGLPVEHLFATLQFRIRRMLGHLGAIPRSAGLAGARRLSTGSQALDGALSGALAPLKAAAGDRTLRTFGGLLNGGRGDAPPGMGNWDNSCYQNSVIQGLASLRPVGTFLTSALSKYRSALDDSTNSALFDLIQQLNDTGNNGKVLWMPAKLKSMSTWQQQDAQEYFSKILDEVDKELLRAARNTSTLPGLAEDKAEEHLPAPPQTQANPLEGFLAQRVACMRCGHSEGLSMIPFNCLTVPLGHEWKYDLSDCLEEYTKLEAIEGVECGKCTLLKTKAQLEQLLQSSTANVELQSTVKNRLQSVEEVLDSDDYSDKALTTTCQISKKNWMTTTKSRQAVVARAPKSLVVHVNRSVFNEMTGAQTKNYAEVSFPATFDLGPWCLGKQEKTKEDWSMNPAESMLTDDLDSDSLPQVLYDLRAVVTHFGRHENGHYICYRKHHALAEDVSLKDAEERWWRLSDEDVSAVSEEDVLKQGGVFMLFYEQSQRQPATVDANWVDIASVVPLPEESEGTADIVVEERDELSGSVKAVSGDPSADNETSVEPTEEERARNAFVQQSRSSLLAELSAALPPIDAADELTATGEGQHMDESSETTTEDGLSNDSEHGAEGASLEQFRPVPSLPPTSASGVKMRTSGVTDERKSSEALDSPLKMASAF